MCLGELFNPLEVWEEMEWVFPGEQFILHFLAGQALVLTNIGSLTWDSVI